MRTEQIVLLAGMFLVVFGTVLRALQLARPDPLKRRIEELSMPLAGAAAGTSAGAGSLEGPNDSKWGQKIAEVSERVAKLSQPKDDDWDRSAVRLRFMRAGFRDKAAPAYFFAAKTLLALALPAISLAFAAPRFSAGHTLDALFVLLAACALGFYAPNVVLSQLTTRRQRAIIEALPDAVDLMTVCVEAGLGLDAAMLRVTEELGSKSPTLTTELHLVLLELRAGAGREKALRNLAARTGVEDIDTLTTMLIQADRFGTSIGDSLRVYTDSMRTKRRMKAEEQAAKIALKLLFPLIFFIFPTLIVVLVGPAAIQIYRHLLPTMGHIGGG
ncbi:type II secretion system protein [Trinickia dabaoshanensis]|uniref:Type II secretion system protein n=1 Tax=Trinickia dabaoshanensis TaxID=564714 RepID=A0A2N7VY99_9BURK|nr:type II secretion system F family protein [Trinickia dabaoshanensis]PMS22125.1 type II secretion system protein [Trinickia dabaoshanensis]